MTNWGSVKSVGGFIAETDNYIYFINGVGTSTDKNDFGTPIKGSLMAADKSDLSKTEIVVPKLFVANDYSAGVYIFGDYVYYGTPSTDKTPEGTVAYSEMAFIKTKLDGKDSKVLFTIDSLSAEYRMVEKDGEVFIIYYDATSSELISYNTAKATKTVIAKTDAKTDGDESLDKYFFFANENLDDAVVVYTTTVYTEKYNEDKVNASVARATANYNKVYAYKVGAESAEVVFDGKDTESTLAITLIENGYVFYTNTDKFATVKNYGASVADFLAKADAKEIIAEYAVATNVIKSLDEVYILDTENGRIYKDDMIKETADKDAESKKLVVMLGTIGSLIDVVDGYAYYYNSNNEIAKVELENKDAKEIRVSEGTATQTWYAPEFVENGGKTLMFYCDNSATGLSYIKYVDINADFVSEDTDEDEEDDLFYIDGVEFIGKMIIADQADLFEQKISAIANDLDNGTLVFETENGELTVSAVTSVRNEYEALDKAIKEEVAESVVETLEKYERAIEIANLFNKLDGVQNYATKSEAEQQAIKTAYDSVKADLQAYYNSDEYTEINALIGQNLKANYTKAVKIFEAE